jgi:SAM-dependent methyltransferase
MRASNALIGAAPGNTGSRSGPGNPGGSRIDTSCLETDDRRVNRPIDVQFDDMAASYSVLEPWYEHLYDLLHAFVRDALGVPRGRRRALDAGCGTGFQTRVLRDLGWVTYGIDVSAGLLAVARRDVAGAALARADLHALPFDDGAFAAAVCCGSTISLVDRPAVVLREIARVLAPGGRLVVEYEHKWSLDLAWSLVSALAGDRLGYGVTPREAWRHVTRPLREGFDLRYPVSCTGSAQAYMLRVFTTVEMRSLLEAVGLRTLDAWGIHGVTNVIPSTVLHREALSAPLAWLYARLRTLDRRLARTPVGRVFANSVVVLAEKRAPDAAVTPALRPRARP